MQMQARVCLQGERTWSNTAGADGQFVNGASSGGQRVGEEPSAGGEPVQYRIRIRLRDRGRALGCGFLTVALACAGAGD
jgi:hypothetical protein